MNGHILKMVIRLVTFLLFVAKINTDSLIAPLCILFDISPLRFLERSRETMETAQCVLLH